MVEATRQVYRDVHDTWRWRLVGADGHVLATAAGGVATEDELDAVVTAIDRAVTDIEVHPTPTGCIVLEDDAPVVVYTPDGTVWCRSKTALGEKEDARQLHERSPVTSPTAWEWVEDGDASSRSLEPTFGSTTWDELPVVEVTEGVVLCHRGHDDEWRWLLHLDGGPVARSGEGYAQRSVAMDVATDALAAIGDAPVTRWGTGQNA